MGCVRCSGGSRTSSSTSARICRFRWNATPAASRHQQQVDVLEHDCDRFNAELPALKSFVLPGGGEPAAGSVARAICRRAEREAFTASALHAVNPLVRTYLNRLSDLLFILARAANAADGHEEPLWRPGSSA